MKACWNTLGSVMKISEGPLSGCTPTENAVNAHGESRGKDNQSGEQGHQSIDDRYLDAGTGKVDVAPKIAGIGGQAGHTR